MTGMRGTNIHPTWWDPATGPSVADRVASMAAAGITHARLDVPWSYVQPTDPAKGGQLHAGYMARLDAVVAELLRVGIEPLVAVTTTPSWASGRTDTRFAPPATNEPYVAFLNTLQRRWRGVHALTVLNEVSYPTNWPGGTVRQYGELLRWARRAAKNIDPTCTVTAGILFQVKDTRSVTFFDEFMRQGYGVDLDVLDVHAYVDAPNHGDGKSWPYDLVQDVVRFAAAKVPGLPVWWTEFGWHTATSTGLPAAKQAYAVEEVHQLAQAAGVARTYAYEFFDGGTDPSNPEHRYGLYDPTTLRAKTDPIS